MFPSTPPELYTNLLHRFYAAAFSNEQRVERIYTFHFVPLGFFPRLIMMLLHEITEQGLEAVYWIGGIRFQHDRQYVLVQHDVTSEVIRVIYLDISDDKYVFFSPSHTSHV